MPPSLADAHLVAQARLREIIARAVTRAWVSLPAYDRANLDEYLSAVIPTVLAGQRYAVNLTDAYVALELDRQPLGIDPTDLIGAGVRAGVDPETVYTRSFVTLWSALGRGTPFDDAVAQGLHRATSTASTDVQLSHRAAYGAIQVADPQIRGYKRQADASACTFCVTVSGAFVKSAGAMPLHNHCGCGLVPVIRDIGVTPTPESVAIHTHGELGPVLTAPGDHFQSLADFT